MFDDRGLASPRNLQDPIYHRTDGGRLAFTHLFGGGVWTCMGKDCTRSWSNDRMKTWEKDGELGERFYTKPDPTPEGEFVIVEKNEEGKAFLGLVPAAEAHLHRKVKL